MPSNLDLLREGKSIEFEPGVTGRLNHQTKKLELSTGEVLDAEGDADFFPQNEQQRSLSKQREYVERNAKGPVGEFMHQYTSQGIPGGIGDWRAYLTQTGEEYTQRKQAEQETSQRISQESPYISAAATGANIATDIALTRGMSAFKAAPLLTAGSAGSRIVTEPQEVLGETVMAAGAGKGLDILGGYFNRIAQRRGNVRALPGQQAAVQEQNALGQQAVADANNLQNQQFNLMKQNVKQVNEARLQQHEADLNIRQNKMIQDQNDFNIKKSARDAEVVRLKNAAETAKFERSATKAQQDAEYRIAKEAAEAEDRRFAQQFKIEQAEHQQALKDLPMLQKKAQEEYSAKVIKNAEAISDSFPKDSKIYSSQFRTNDFIDESINKSALAGSREAGQASRILKAIMPEGEILTAKDLATRYKALEGAIQKSSPEVASILNEFKAHMGMNMNTMLADNMAYSLVMPTLKKQILKDVQTSLDTMGFQPFPTLSLDGLKRKAEGNLNQLFREMTPEDFIRKFQSGEIKEHILKKVMRADDFAQDFSYINSNKFGKMGNTSNRADLLSEGSVDIQGQDLRKFSFIFNSKLDNALAKSELKMIGVEGNATKRLGGKLKNTYGMSEPVSPPNAPISPNEVQMPVRPSEIPEVPPIQYPDPVTRPSDLPMPAKPSLMSNPAQPTAQVFNPIPEPTLAPAQGMLEGVGDMLERNNLMGGNTLTNNPLTKLAGLKYLLGKGALPAELAYMGMKGLTSPTMGGEVARMTFKQGGIQAIQSWAEKYPSYQNGILQNPQERRSLTKEIEDDAEIPLEQKAILQSKVNRGKPLNQRL